MPLEVKGLAVQREKGTRKLGGENRKKDVLSGLFFGLRNSGESSLIENPERGRTKETGGEMESKKRFRPLQEKAFMIHPTLKLINALGTGSKMHHSRRQSEVNEALRERDAAVLNTVSFEPELAFSHPEG